MNVSNEIESFQWAVLLDAQLERVFGEGWHRVVLSELSCIWQLRFPGVAIEATIETIAGSQFLLVAANAEDANSSSDSPDQLKTVLSSLSSGLCLFRYRAPSTFEIVEPSGLRSQHSSVLTIQRFKGKTNELFTRMMLGIVLAGSTNLTDLRTVRILDPVAGRGTTLNAAVSLGVSASGVELDPSSYEEYSNFILRWLKDNRVKHHATNPNVRDAKGKKCARLTIQYDFDRDRYRDDDRLQIDMINGSTVEADTWFKKGSFNGLVADLPYGIQHSARQGQSYYHSAADLLADALPVWKRMLTQRGVVALAWNLRAVPRARVDELLDEAGFQVIDLGVDLGFEHRVDQSIQRDLVIAQVRLPSRAAERAASETSPT